MQRRFYSGGIRMNKRTMKKGLAIVLALMMVFAMTATAFAATGNGYSVVGSQRCTVFAAVYELDRAAAKSVA